MNGPTIGVCGFGRCGSSMVMEMLYRGGIPLVAGTQPISRELPDLERVADLTPEDLAGRAVKLLDYHTRAPLPQAQQWRFVWIDRNAMEQARSTAKFLKGIAGIRLPAGSTRDLARSYRRDRDPALARLRSVGTVVVLNYERVLNDPLHAALTLKRIAPTLQVMPAAEAVHHRDPQCAVGLDFEHTGQAPHG